MEIVDGGIWAENKVFNMLGSADPVIERQLAGLVPTFDIIITMGSGAARFLRGRGATGEIHVIPGGVDPATYRPSVLPPRTDLIFVGRLAPIKRLDLLLDAVRLVKTRIPGISLTIIGDGDLRGTLEVCVQALGLSSNVTFAGQRADVNEWIARSRLFVLTSQTEGVSLSLMEAFASGIPAVVSDVGDLGDVVVDGVNGFLVPGRSAEAIATRILELLADEPRRRRFAAEALRASQSYQLDAITRRWDEVFARRAAESIDSSLTVHDGAAV
jgi:glycosyltransferase involved in cell wall biosynthesis